VHNDEVLIEHRHPVLIREFLHKGCPDLLIIIRPEIVRYPPQNLVPKDGLGSVENSDHGTRPHNVRPLNLGHGTARNVYFKQLSHPLITNEGRSNCTLRLRHPDMSYHVCRVEHVVANVRHAPHQQKGRLNVRRIAVEHFAPPSLLVPTLEQESTFEDWHGFLQATAILRKQQSLPQPLGRLASARENPPKANNSQQPAETAKLPMLLERVIA
jgi:hypothetical protein